MLNRAVNGDGALAGILYAAPIVTAFLPLSFAFGLSARESGLTFLQTFLMSLLVYAGSSQMVAVSLIASGEAAWMIVVTTFIVNSRMLLLSAAIAPSLDRWKIRERLAFGYLLTDESFALLMTRFRTHAPSAEFALAVNAASHLAWATGTALGHLFSGLIPDVKPFGLDFALVSMLLALLALQLREWTMVWVVLFSGILAVWGVHAGLGSQAILVATLLGPLLGTAIEFQKARRCRTERS